MYANTHPVIFPVIIVRTIAFFIFLLGVLVLLAWHRPESFKTFSSPLTVAYSTAVCLLLCALSLLLLTLNKQYFTRAAAGVVLLIGVLTCLEIYAKPDLDVNVNLMLLVADQPPSPVSMALTTAVSFILVSLSLLLLSFSATSKSGVKFIASAYLNLCVIAIAMISLLGVGLSLMPEFVWLGIKMAPLTAVGLILFSLALLSFSYRPTLISFGRLNFLSQIVMAFGFLTLLFVGMGSIVLTQIDSVSSIIQELYKNPLQVNNAGFRIRNEVSVFNRDLKDIAIRPDLASDQDIRKRLEQVEKNIRTDVTILKQKIHIDPMYLQKLEINLREWIIFINRAGELFSAGDYRAYSAVILDEGQKKSVELENITEDISLQAQNQMMELNASVLNIENNAKKLVMVSVMAFLGFGLLVAYLITRNLTNQLHDIRRAMLAIAHKETDTVIPYLAHTQEVGEMARALAVFAESIKAGRRMEERLRQVIEAAPNGIVMVTDQGTIEIVNRQAEKIFGYDRSELIGQPVEMLVPLRVATAHPGHRASFFNNPSPRAMGSGRDLFGLRRDGVEFPLEIGLAPIETEEGLKVLASIVDITERKKSAQLLIEHQIELEASNKELVRINKELETFAYVASHDLKSPLRGISQLSSWIEEDFAENKYDSIVEHTRMMRNRILRMEKLLDDLLVFYRAGRVDSSLSVIDVRKIAWELFEIHNNKPGLTLSLGEDLPTITSLNTPFEQVLRNLLSNAIKHHDLEQGVISLTSEDLDENFYAFSVCDDGPGVPEQYHERIFRMFQTLKPRDELEGSGMGLALIKKIVENYGGEISITSRNRGACFRFTWPKHIQRRRTNA